MRIKSLDGLLTDAKYLAKLVGQEEQLEQADAAIKAFTTENGLGGIDTKRPLAAFVDISGGQLQPPPVVLLIPIADEKTFLDFLGNFQIKAEKGKDGVYTLSEIPAPIPYTIYFRFAHKYAYVTLDDKENIAEKKIPKPEQVVFATGDDSVAALDLRLDALPDSLKQIALAQLEGQLATGKEQKVENETPAQKQFRLKFIDLFGAHFKAILTDGEALSLKLGLNAKKDDLSVDLSFKAKTGSALAKEIESVGKSTSLFANLGQGAALQVALAASLPEELKKSLGPIVDDMIKEGVEKEKDAEKAKDAKLFGEALAPTLKAGELDAGVALRGPDSSGHYTLVAGLKLKDAKHLESALRTSIAAKDTKEREKVQFDAATIGDVKVHKLLIDDENSKKVFGAWAPYVAFKDDAMLVAVGPDALKALKDAVALQPAAGPVVNVNVAFAKVAGLAPDPKMQKAIKEVFGETPTGDNIALTVEMGETPS